MFQYFDPKKKVSLHFSRCYGLVKALRTNNIITRDNILVEMNKYSRELPIYDLRFRPATLDDLADYLGLRLTEKGYELFELCKSRGRQFKPSNLERIDQILKERGLSLKLPTIKVDECYFWDQEKPSEESKILCWRNQNNLYTFDGSHPYTNNQQYNYNIARILRRN